MVKTLSCTQPKYLIIGPSWVGDMVMAQSLFMEIKRGSKQAIIDVLSPNWSAPIVQRMPEVNQLIGVDFQHGKLVLKERYRIAKALRKEKYTHSIVLPNSLKSALVPFFASIPKRIGYIGEQRWGLLNNIRRLDKKQLPMTVQRFVGLARQPLDTCELQGMLKPKLAIDHNSVKPLLGKYKISLDKPCLFLCPGAEFGQSKQWPAKHYAELAKIYNEQGWQVYLMGSENDVSVCLQISQMSGQACQVLAGKTSLTEAIDLMSCATLVVSNDSGLMHIAAACHVPLVALYGSTDPDHTPPLSEKTQLLKMDLECQPCHKRVCPLQHHDCMNTLSVDRVVQAADALIKDVALAKGV